MRFSLLGFGGPIPPLTLMLQNDVPFEKESYVLAGYTNYEVICIGGAGGNGSGLNTEGLDESDIGNQRPYGGAGGGGGIHRIRGLLSILPASCSVRVGGAGSDQINAYSSGDLVTMFPGQDGGYSSFNDDACVAGGGTGGGQAVIFSDNMIGGVGGSGGLGGTTNAGTGAEGGTPADSSGFVPDAIDGADGSWNGTIGSGGGGGAGGVGLWGLRSFIDLASKGGRGAWNPADQSVFGNGGNWLFPTLFDEFESGRIDIGHTGDEGALPGLHATVVPGPGGGCRATPFNGLLLAYGTRDGGQSGDGAVLIRLTKV